MIKEWQFTFADSLILRLVGFVRGADPSFITAPSTQRAIAFASFLLTNFTCRLRGADSGDVQTLYGEELARLFDDNESLITAFSNGCRVSVLLELSEDAEDTIRITMTFHSPIGEDKYVVVLIFPPKGMPRVVCRGTEYGLPPDEW